MSATGKERLMWEVEKFVVTRLRPLQAPHYDCDDVSNLEKRQQLMDESRKSHENKYRNSQEKLVGFSQLTNHEICHEMFWNAFRGRSKMYIQIENFMFDEDRPFHRPDEKADENGITEEDEVIVLQCSLLTSQMLEYDIMMFNAMSDSGDEEYKEEARKFYRPYLFSYVAEINREKYERLRELQRKTEKDWSVEEDGSSYLWLACTFNPDINVPKVGLSGYVVQSASSINKIKADLYIIEDEKTPRATVKEILDKYKLRPSCKIDDDSFIRKIESKLGNDRLSTIDVYKIGNGNCIYAQTESGNMSFFYDIGFNYRHRPGKIASGVKYSYSRTMKEIYGKQPSFFILSHWDMDHVAGGVAAGKGFLDKDWFAPDCYDACIDAKRLAKYLDMKGHLFLAKRPPRQKKSPGRLIGRQIDIKSTAIPSQTLATYRFYLGGKAKCDGSYPNCEGIVIEYTDVLNEKAVLMMGDVNYSSFNSARPQNQSFAQTKIHYLIAPHHGSERTDYKKIADSGRIAIPGIEAIICCTNEEDVNRPNKYHRKELGKRFEGVWTTEEAPPTKNSISIILQQGKP